MSLYCPGPSFRSVDYGYSDSDLAKFKENREQSKIKILDWLVIRKPLNQMGFTDEEITQAIKDGFKPYSRVKKGETFESVFLHWVTETIEIKDEVMKNYPVKEQISGKFTKSVEKTDYKGCKTITWYEKEDSFIEWRIPSRHHEDSIVRALMYNKFSFYKKFDTRKTRRGLGFMFLDKDDLNKSYVEFRTRLGDISLNLEQIVKGKFDFTEAIEKEINEYKEWNKEQMSMNDKDLKKYLDERGFIYVYDGKGHEEENLVKKYIPTPKQQRREWDQTIEQIKAKYNVKDFKDFIISVCKVVRNE